MQALEELAVSYDTKDREIQAVHTEKQLLTEENEHIQVFCTCTCTCLYITWCNVHIYIVCLHVHVYICYAQSSDLDHPRISFHSCTMYMYTLYMYILDLINELHVHVHVCATPLTANNHIHVSHNLNVEVTCVCIHIHVYTYNVYMYMYMHVYICTCTCIYTCTCTLNTKKRFCTHVHCTCTPCTVNVLPPFLPSLPSLPYFFLVCLFPSFPHPFLLSFLLSLSQSVLDQRLQELEKLRESSGLDRRKKNELLSAIFREVNEVSSVLSPKSEEWVPLTASSSSTTPTLEIRDEEFTRVRVQLSNMRCEARSLTEQRAILEQAEREAKEKAQIVMKELANCRLKISQVTCACVCRLYMYTCMYKNVHVHCTCTFTFYGCLGGAWVSWCMGRWVGR